MHANSLPLNDITNHYLNNKVFTTEQKLSNLKQKENLTTSDLGTSILIVSPEKVIQKPEDNIEFDSLTYKYKYLKNDLNSKNPMKCLQSSFFEIQDRLPQLDRHPILQNKMHKLLRDPKLQEKLISSLIQKIKENDFITPSFITLQKDDNIFHMSIDMGLSIALVGTSLTINGTPASEHGLHLLFEANRLLEMLHLQTKETSCSKLGVYSARQGFILVSNLEKEYLGEEYFDIDLTTRWKAAYLATDLASLILSKEGTTFLKKDSLAEFHLNALVEYSKDGTISNQDVRCRNLFVNEFPLTNEESQFHLKIFNKLMRIQSFIEEIGF